MTTRPTEWQIRHKMDQGKPTRGRCKWSNDGLPNYLLCKRQLYRPLED